MEPHMTTTLEPTAAELAPLTTFRTPDSSLTPAVERVAQFHLAFGHPCPNHYSFGPPNLKLLRMRLLVEELVELAIALGARDPHMLISALLDENEGMRFRISPDAEFTDEVDPIAVADALSDIAVVTLGAGVSMGYRRTLGRCFDEVMDSNMTKLGEDGKPVMREDGKIGKGPNYRRPNLTPILFPAA
jgi:predicted HAD superfamily Cof-like phosphohydrolase